MFLGSMHAVINDGLCSYVLRISYNGCLTEMTITFFALVCFLIWLSNFLTLHVSAKNLEKDYCEHSQLFPYLNDNSF